MVILRLEAIYSGGPHRNDVRPVRVLPVANSRYYCKLDNSSDHAPTSADCHPTLRKQPVRRLALVWLCMSLDQTCMTPLGTPPPTSLSDTGYAGPAVAVRTSSYGSKLCPGCLVYLSGHRTARTASQDGWLSRLLSRIL